MFDRLIVELDLAGPVPAEPLAMAQPVEKAWSRRATLSLNHGKSAPQPAAAPKA
ncbi:hypothetical protein [Sandarakinorhabdus sp.]|uniref:hypothetical protein n=1 Tax=Sandarakinorhabdus sp. TaxID=1916663 RepID=UPI00286E4BA3|nr:hypothetical protein [Sandarakinorhabdus sp.]